VPVDIERENGNIVQSLQTAVWSGNAGLSDVPPLVVQVIREHRWQDWVEYHTQAHVHFERFQDFVRAAPPEGLGADVRTLKNLCRDNAEALQAITAETTGDKGGDRRSQDFKDHNIIFEKAAEQGTSVGYAHRRLAKAAPALHQRVLAGELSPHAAMVLAGFRHPTITIPSDDLEAAARRLRRHFTCAELAALIELLDDG
jgi:hypothetical protein